MKTLDEAKPGDTLLVLAITTADNDLRHKLETMGLIPGQSLHVHNCSPSGLIAEVKGSRLALGMDLATGLLVEKIEPARHWQKTRKYENMQGDKHEHLYEHHREHHHGHGHKDLPEHIANQMREHIQEHESKKRRGWFRK